MSLRSRGPLRKAAEGHPRNAQRLPHRAARDVIIHESTPHTSAPAAKQEVGMINDNPSNPYLSTRLEARP